MARGCILLLVAAILNSCSARRINWRETYRAKSKQPYGTFLISELLRSYFPDSKFSVLQKNLGQSLSLPILKHSNYVFVGEALYLDSLDRSALLGFVKQGNTAFISSRTLPYELMDSIYNNQCQIQLWEDYQEIVDSTVVLGFRHPGLASEVPSRIRFVQGYHPTEYYWQYIDQSSFCESTDHFFPIGYMQYHDEQLANFARISYGEGHFFLHTTPLAFTNFNLLDTLQLKYAERVFTHLVPGPIFWDSHSKVPEVIGRRLNRSGTNRQLKSGGALQYILSQPALTWAWYLLLALGIIYLIFRSKRRQRIIPVREPNSNTSLEFLGIVSRLYLMQNKNNHKPLALQKMKLLRAFIRDRYHLHFRSDADDDLLKTLAEKSAVAPSVLENLLRLNKNIEAAPVTSEQELISFHHAMDEFYKNCK